jgi:hypothetical protein
MGVRNINDTTKASLLAEKPFTYAHLVKFEKPLLTPTGKSGRRPEDYVYLSDGSYDIVFDDKSTTALGVPNGDQTYIASKIRSVGSITETIEAKTTSMSLQLSAAALSTTVSDTYTVTSGTLTGTKDLVDEGFREGDVITVTGGLNDGKSIRIESFELNNTRANITPQNTTMGQGSGQSLTLTFASPEIEGIITERDSSADSTYAKYLNRDVFVYKTHLRVEEETIGDTVYPVGSIIGEPYLIFKGIIGSGKISEDPSKSSMITWTLTSHWGDFSRVQGRITSDGAHRALDENNKASPLSAIRPAYAGDLGFLHSEQAINLVSIYQIKETRTKLKMKRNWAGMKKYKQIEYQVEVDREADLRFNLDAKYLPVIYGVNKIDSIPVFVDTLVGDSRKVFVAYAICEGEVAGIYDMYFDDTTSICIDQNDNDTRATQTAENTIDVLCAGRMDRGDTLLGGTIVGGTVQYATGTTQAQGAFGNDWYGVGAAWEAQYAQSTFQSTINNTPVFQEDTNGFGITHGKGITFSTPIDAKAQFFSGKSDQKAADMLLSNVDNFKVGNEYYQGSEPYWGANHRLLDTAYMVVEYTIGEGETQIPTLDFVVRGKGVPCYNYDHAFELDSSVTGESITNFQIGQSVTVKGEVSGESDVTIGTATVKDIYQISPIGKLVKEARIQFTSNPTDVAFKKFYITDGTNTLHLVSHDAVEESGTLPTTLATAITGVSNNSGGGIDIAISSSSDVHAALLAFPTDRPFSIIESLTEEFSPTLLNQFVADSVSSGSLANVGETQTSASTIIGDFVVAAKNLKLNSSTASGTADAYNGMDIEVSTTLGSGEIRTQRRNIVDYDGSSKTVLVDTPFEFLPKQGDSYKILGSQGGDLRVTNNPAMQLLDYMQSDRYGRNLSLDQDLDAESFFQTARACDTQSNVTLFVGSNAPVVGDVYKYATSSSSYGTAWQGTVKSVGDAVTIDGNTRRSVVFENVLGKIVTRWADWKVFADEDLYYHNGRLYEHSGSASTVSEPAASGSSDFKTSLTITKVSGSGSSTLAVDINRNSDATYKNRHTFEGDPVVKTYSSLRYSSGYSLYDSDDVKYWRYLGWESQNQRHVTRHQTNVTLDTSKSIFSNINSMLGHFNGMLRYSAGKYSLALKKGAETPTSITVGSETYIVEDINETDIIGKIDVQDAGQKGTYNQVDVGINDPQNRFEGRSIMMFNSKYLKEDRMVPKKGSVKAPYVTNYFNARMNAKQYLDESRASVKVNFTIAPRGVLLLAGDLIRISYPRFGWTNKIYRITNLSINANCLVQVTAEEHEESAYLIDTVEVSEGSIIPAPAPVTAPVGVPTGPNANSLTATTTSRGGVELNWVNASNFNPATYTTEIWKASVNDRGHSSLNLIGTSQGNTYTDPVIGEGTTTNYYWIRYAVNVAPSNSASRQVFSAYEPSSATGGIEGTSNGALDAIIINLTNDNVSIPTSSGSLDFSNTGITLTVAIGGTQIDYDDTSAYTLPSFRVSSVTPSNVTLGNITTGSDSYSLAPITAINGASGIVLINIIVTDSLGNDLTFTRAQTLSVSPTGPTGGTGPQGGTGPGGPVGPTGGPGVTGPIGPGGPVGPTGPAGPTGVTGPIGQGGPAGPQGPAGPTGVTGPIGQGGPAGPQGPTGAAGVTGPIGQGGPAGPTGAGGPTGGVGPAGPGGPAGATGGAGPTGGVGPAGPGGGVGPAGPVGPAGSTGPAGPQGGTGPGGPVGPAGGTGPAGATGGPGPAGPNGPVGPAGTTPGPTGGAGPAGPGGPTGPAGTTPGPTGGAGPAGPAGPAGATGGAGPAGPQGPTGGTGPGGPQGATGGAGPAGPQGATGPGGPGGAVGPTGGPGPAGPQGSTGPGGAVGPTGGPGPAGPQGSTGPGGPVGPTGGAGPTGPDGSTGPGGPVGPTGGAGPTGATGGPGPQGPNGPTGGAGPQGPTGGPGPGGPVGPTGAAGPTGAQGSTGPGGPVGPTGGTGPGGPNGPTGPGGAAGPTGGPGGSGVQGPTGPAGAPGATIAFDTVANGGVPRSDSLKKSTIEAVKSPALAGDVYWHIPSDRAFKYNGSGTSFTEYARVSAPGSSGSIKMDGTNGRIEVYQGSTLRVRIGQL